MLGTLLSVLKSFGKTGELLQKYLAPWTNVTECSQECGSGTLTQRTPKAGTNPAYEYRTVSCNEEACDTGKLKMLSEELQETARRQTFDMLFRVGVQKLPKNAPLCLRNDGKIVLQPLSNGIRNKMRFTELQTMR